MHCSPMHEIAGEGARDLGLHSVCPSACFAASLVPRGRAADVLPEVVRPMALLDRLRPQPAWKHADPAVRIASLDTLPESEIGRAHV